MAGVIAPWYPRSNTTTPIAPTPTTTPSPNSQYNPLPMATAANKQATDDYSDIMSSFRNYLNSVSAPSPALSNITSGYSNLMTPISSGYSSSDVNNLRERGISPIRSIYANAQRNVNQQRSLSGGYSPNYNAVTAKMARDESSQIGDQVSRVNADIADKVASNKLATEGLNTQRATTGLSGLMSAYQTPFQNALPAISGMSSMYGSTPGLANMYGNQAFNSAQLDLSGKQVQLSADEQARRNAETQSQLDLQKKQLGILNQQYPSSGLFNPYLTSNKSLTF